MNPEQNDETNKPQADDRSKVVDPSEDLVYKGGYTNDPLTILGNPAVTPQTLSDARDLRPDLFREPEEDEA
ncbi:MAG TPA: hypothetical protein V6D10_22425 [Trichocoleus sp.]|jgi:hypothetical protein